MKLKKLLLILFFLSIFFPYFFKYFITNNKLKVFNHLYFDSPFNFIDKKVCKNYDLLVKNSFDNSFSVSIIDKNGYIITEYNQNNLRIPASNIKLFSSAYVLNKYKYYDTLKTSLYKSHNNKYFIIGSGDPDLLIPDIEELISHIKYSKKIKLSLVEVNNDILWPKGWTNSDKLFSYGSPITSLAISSNDNPNKDIYTVSKRVLSYLKTKYPLSDIDISIVDREKFNSKNVRLLKEVNSNTILSLITLVNAESHNFTAEILFKNASNTWNQNEYNSLKDWLNNKGLPVENIIISDASGLSRNNLVTTKLISSFLHKMKYNKNFEIYNSSLSITGIRGTLANKLNNSEVKGKFFGKTGTLSNVFAISGYLYKKDGPITVSIIQNSSNISPNKVFKFLNNLYYLEDC